MHHLLKNENFEKKLMFWQALGSGKTLFQKNKNHHLGRTAHAKNGIPREIPDSGKLFKGYSYVFTFFVFLLNQSCVKESQAIWLDSDSP